MTVYYPFITPSDKKSDSQDFTISFENFKTVKETDNEGYLEQLGNYSLDEYGTACRLQGINYTWLPTEELDSLQILRIDLKKSSQIHPSSVIICLNIISTYFLMRKDHPLTHDKLRDFNTNNREPSPKIDYKSEENPYYVGDRYLSHLSNCIKLLSNKSSKRLMIALNRWDSSYKRQDPLDVVLDCCSALEALFGFKDELRLKLAFGVYNVVRTDKKKLSELVYRMYGIRSQFIHGAKIPEINITEAHEFIIAVFRVFLSIIKDAKLLDSEKLSKLIFENYGGSS